MATRKRIGIRDIEHLGPECARKQTLAKRCQAALRWLARMVAVLDAAEKPA
jgi:hypothetical protein